MMLMRASALAAVVLACLALAPFAVAQRGDAAGGGSPAATAYDFSAVTAAINGAVQSAPLTGASMLIVKDGETLYEQHFGAYGSNTAVFIASATKWLSAAAFMTLVDGGLVSLDDPVAQHLPEWTGAAGTITVRQLWSHTSGLPADHACLADGAITLAQCVEQIRVAGLQAAPGTQFYYGGASMQVAGRIAEVVTGQSWAQLFNERIATPLGMTATTYWPSILNPRIAGGASSTLHDYGLVMAMLLAAGAHNGAPILQAATVAEMQADQTDGVPIAYSPHLDQRRYGIGEWRDVVDVAGNAIQLSSQGAFGFSPWLDVQRGYFAVFLVQDQLANVYVLVTQLQQLVIEALSAPASVGGDARLAAVPAAGDGRGRMPWAATGALVALAAAAIAARGLVKRRRRE